MTYCTEMGSPRTHEGQFIGPTDPLVSLQVTPALLPLCGTVGCAWGRRKSIKHLWGEAPGQVILLLADILLAAACGSNGRANKAAPLAGDTPSPSPNPSARWEKQTRAKRDK